MIVIVIKVSIIEVAGKKQNQKDTHGGGGLFRVQNGQKKREKWNRERRKWRCTQVMPVDGREMFKQDTKTYRHLYTKREKV